MYPTLSGLIYYLTGVELRLPISTFTFFLSLAVCFGYCLLSSELKRKEKKGVMTGFYNSKRVYIRPHQQAWNIVFISLTFGLIGSRLFSIMQNPFPFYEAPLYTLFSLRGSVFFGGFILALICVIIYAKDRRLKLLHLLDAMSPALILAYAIGRSGCYISGDWVCGINNNLEKPTWISYVPDWLWAYENSSNEMIETVPVFPTQLYEACICGILFLILWSLRKITIPGMIFSLYLLFYGLERFFIEQLRTEDTYQIIHLFFKQAQTISLVLIIMGSMMLYAARKNHKSKFSYNNNLFS